MLVQWFHFWKWVFGVFDKKNSAKLSYEKEKLAPCFPCRISNSRLSIWSRAIIIHGSHEKVPAHFAQTVEEKVEHFKPISIQVESGQKSSIRKFLNDKFHETVAISPSYHTIQQPTRMNMFSIVQPCVWQIKKLKDCKILRQYSKVKRLHI